MSKKLTLVVDLDGTLIRSDCFFETFFSFIARNLGSFSSFTKESIKGKAALKAYLAEVTDIDVSLLPFDQSVVDLVRNHREEGGATALVTATDQKLAESVAGYLDCFDDVHGSDGMTNLKGPAKASFLVDKFGVGNFDYIGDSVADLHVWEHARRAFTVNASNSLRRKVENTAREVVHIENNGSIGAGPGSYIRALRPHQWVKNILVFLPVIAAQSNDWDHWLWSAFAFLAFSLVASSAYVLNDLLDLAADRAHPRKQHRPFASGSISLWHGAVMAIVVLGLGLASAFLVPARMFVFVLLGYYALTLMYSVSLKRRLVIDIFTLAGLYTMRIFTGGIATGLPLSPWILALSVFLFLCLAAIKRQAELVDSLSTGKAEASGRAYITKDLPIVATMAIASGYLAVLVLALYINSPAVKTLYTSPDFLWGACPVLLYWISHMAMIAHRGEMHDDPIIFAIRDRASHICGALMALIVFAASTI